MSTLLKAAKLFRNKGGAFSPADVKELDGKDVIAFYFSAHWCPPCRAFTPELKDFYNEVNKGSSKLEVVFFSFDRSKESCHDYLKEAHGDWLFLEAEDPKIEEIANKFNVEGIPALLLVNKNGEKVGDVRADVTGIPPLVAISQWIEKVKQ
ncbi:unnamed protein product [Bursaphelenchus xylophilus]|uniref:protein-disulfide reductase n=1 Tax=Bursaphelenchus xylophilus TaxID=6326 RepID=A0A1I7RQ57_BURXY|nr:unnamed protein product [Bursaphelenchus xylophilus]CAG9097199.1 unnamed protein product [Bursaphelenchus xylophilus]